MARFMRWLGAGLFILFLIGCFAVVNVRYAAMLLWTFAHAETAALGWLVLGFTPRSTFVICTMCSSLDIIGWVYLSGGMRFTLQLLEAKLAKSASPLLKNLARIIHWLEGRLDKRLTPSPKKGVLERLMHFAPYPVLPVFGYLPGLIGMGAVLARFKRVHPVVIFALLALGNAGKMATAVFGTHYAIFELHKHLVALKR